MSTPPTIRKDIRVLSEAIKYIETVSSYARLYAAAVSSRTREDVPDPAVVLAGLRKIRSSLEIQEGGAKVAKRL